MPKIIVSSLSKLHDTVREHGARRILTLINASTPVPRPEEVAAENHLFLGFNDITEETDGLVAPSAAHVEDLIRWAKDWDQRAPMVVHCYAGISRSTAAAYTSALCPQSGPRRISHSPMNFAAARQRRRPTSA